MYTKAQKIIDHLAWVSESIDIVSNTNEWKEIINSEYSDPELNTSLEDVKHYLLETIIRLENYLVEINK